MWWAAVAVALWACEAAFAQDGSPAGDASVSGAAAPDGAEPVVAPDEGAAVARSRAELEAEGRQALEGRRYEVAARIYAAAAQAHPDVASFHAKAGIAQLGLGNVAEAARWFRQASEREPTSARFHTLHGDALSQLGREREARLAYLAALAVAPEHAPARRGLQSLLTPGDYRARISAAFAEGRDRRGQALLDEAIIAHPSEGLFWAARARLRLQRGNGVGALADAKRAVQLEPESAPFRALLEDARNAPHVEERDRPERPTVGYHLEYPLGGLGLGALVGLVVVLNRTEVDAALVADVAPWLVVEILPFAGIGLAAGLLAGLIHFAVENEASLAEPRSRIGVGVAANERGVFGTVEASF